MDHRAIRFLRWFCPDHLREEIEGDLLQRYDRDVQAKGKRYASGKLWWNAVRYLRPGIWLRNRYSGIETPFMLRNHFILAWRHLTRARLYTSFHVAGLAIGFVSFILILQYVVFELSYDRFQRNHERIYRVAYEKHDGRKLLNSSAGTFFGVGNLLRDEFPEVEEVVRFYRWPANTGAVLMANGKVFNERNYFFSEQGFFKLFPALLVKGDPASCLSQPKSIVISRRLAVSMFGTEDALGKEISRLDLQEGHCVVTGIMIDPPEQTHLKADVVIPYDQDWIPDDKGTWLFPGNLTYVLLKPGADAMLLESKLNEIVLKLQPENKEVMNSRAVFQPLTSIHFSAYQQDEIGAGSNLSVVYGIAWAGLIILFIAWINYVNLSISGFLRRVREAGIRRIVGSTKGQLFGQFFVQYVLIATIAGSVSALVVWGFDAVFTEITGTHWLGFGLSATWPWIAAVIVFVAGSLIAGIYPSYFLLRTNPVVVLGGRSMPKRTQTIKRILISFQLIASLSLLALLFVIVNQLDFMRAAERHMELDRVVTVYNSTSYSVHEDSLKKEHSLAFRHNLLQNPAFIDVSASSVVPGEPVGFTYHNLTKRMLDTPDDNVPYKVVFIDESFIPVYRLPLLKGRNYSVENGEDRNQNTIIINKAAALALGFSSVEEAIDKEIYFMVTFDWKKYRIVGIVDDYRQESAKAAVFPTVFYFHQQVGQMTYYSILIDGKSNMGDALAAAERTWKEVWPEKPFDYFFADQHYEQQYKAEVQLTRIFTFFASIAIFLACLGVLGMTLFEVNSRMREISIRKVLGASVTNLIGLLTKDNFRLLLLSVFVAAPMIYFLATRWLNAYPVRIPFSWTHVVVPFLVLAALIGTTAILQTLKGALTNPADHLKHE